ncbi:MAG: hypothetical protein CSA38_00415 [Flavobacteriales bacterium]|nr:MAG: hypothetical protein CSA38_00415 [Flavobacteriales bacterium]
MNFKAPKFVQWIHRFFDNIHIPFLGISLWKMFEIYGQGLFKTKIGRKAAAISWNFVLALFPFVLFVLSILPYLPHYDKLNYYIYEVLLGSVFPGEIETDVKSYIEQSILPNTSGISNLTIILALFFATNGTFAIIDGFNEKSEEKLNDIKEYILSFFITVGFISVLLLSLFGIYYAEVVLKLFNSSEEIGWLAQNLTKIISFFSFPIFYFLLLTTFYWVGTVKATRFSHAVPGAILTTVLFIITTYGFAFYVANFARYNVLYGSIGTMILLMVWVNVNVYLLLFGNELNYAIRNVRKQKLEND